jgi:hypothetical protein
MTQAFWDQYLSAEFVRVAAPNARAMKIRVRKNKKSPACLPGLVTFR